MKINCSRTRRIALILLVSATLAGGLAQAQLAYDNADLYPGNPDHGWPLTFNVSVSGVDTCPLADE
jgi:hypothetical protein